jgi:hypothetical protein
MRRRMGTTTSEGETRTAEKSYAVVHVVVDPDDQKMLLSCADDDDSSDHGL